MKKNLFMRIILICIFLFCIEDCGPSLKNAPKTGTGSATSGVSESNGSSNTQANQNIQIPVHIYYDSASLGLLDVTSAVSYSVTLSGCATGFTQTSSTTLAPYKFDKGCFAKLTQFVFDGTDNFVYDQVSTGSTAFTNTEAGYATGEQAIFATADVTAPSYKVKLRVYVQQQLSDPIANGDQVIYRFSSVDKGADKTVLKSTIDQNGTVFAASDVAPPAFTISSSTLVNITSNGAGEWQFVMQCADTITGAADTRACDAVVMLTAIRVKLVKDTWGGVPQVPDLETAFGVTGGSGSAVVSGNIHDALGLTPNGGFKTPNTGEANVLTGPDQMHLNPNMILILRSEDPNFSGEYSWQYFKVDVDTSG